VDHVIEVVLEVMDVKKKVFAELDEVTRKDVILSSNTSSMSLPRSQRPRKGPTKSWYALFQPGSLMKLVEVIRGVNTATRQWPPPLSLQGRWARSPSRLRLTFPAFSSTG